MIGRSSPMVQEPAVAGTGVVAVTTATATTATSTTVQRQTAAAAVLAPAAVTMVYVVHCTSSKILKIVNCQVVNVNCVNVNSFCSFLAKKYVGYLYQNIVQYELLKINKI